MKVKAAILQVMGALMMTGVAAAATETYKVDPVHSRISFVVTHLMVSEVEGNFKDFSGEIQFDEKELKNSSVSVSIKSASINTENEKRDGHLNSPDFFDTAKFPDITFKSEKILSKGDGYLAVGPLTMRGVTKEVQIPFKVKGPVQLGPTKKLGVTGSLTINRQDYGVSWSKSLDTGGVAVSDEVTINLKIEAGTEPPASAEKSK